MKKNTKKTKSPEVIVDCINFETVNDLYDNYTYAKVRAGKVITEEELDEVVANKAGKIADIVFVAATVAMRYRSCNWCKTEKKPWYKRFWNWLRRK